MLRLIELLIVGVLLLLAVLAPDHNQGYKEDPLTMNPGYHNCFKVNVCR
jgi:hypothetical protein